MKLLRKIVSIMPEKMRHKFIRSKIVLGSGAPPNIIFKLAETKDELEQAFRVLHDAYVEQGFMDPHPSGLRVTKYHALPTTSVLIAKDTSVNEVIATISIVRNTALGLPLDNVFPMAEIKKNHRHFAEVSSLAIKKAYRREPGDVLWPLLRYFYLYLRNVMRIDAYVIGVNPSWHDLYKGILGFTKLEGFEAAEYGFVNNAPVATYFVDVLDQELLFYKFYAELPDRANFYKYCVKTRLNSGQYRFPHRRYFEVHNAVMTKEFFEYFFVEKTDTFAKLTDTEKRMMLQYYPRGDEFQHTLKAEEMIVESSRFFKRFVTRFSAKLKRRGDFENDLDLAVLDFSMLGLRVESSFEIRGEVELRVAIGQFDSSYIRALVKNRTGGTYGLEILECDQAWLEFISAMQIDFQIRPNTAQANRMAEIQARIESRKKRKIS